MLYRALLYCTMVWVVTSKAEAIPSSYWSHEASVQLLDEELNKLQVGPVTIIIVIILILIIVVITISPYHHITIPPYHHITSILVLILVLILIRRVNRAWSKQSMLVHCPQHIWHEDPQ